jgi:hypothetical protein
VKNPMNAACYRLAVLRLHSLRQALEPASVQPQPQLGQNCDQVFPELIGRKRVHIYPDVFFLDSLS